MRHDDEDELEIERKPAMPKGEWILGVCGIGAILLFGFGLGVSLGQSRTEVKAKTGPTEVAQVEPTKPGVPEPTATTPTKAEPTKATPTKPEVKPTKPEVKPTKPTPPTTPATKPATPPTTPATKPEPMVTPVLFAEKIAVIFKNNCNVCHGSPSIKGGLDTRTLASIAKGGDNGAAVVAKNLEKSYLWQQVESGAMPPAGKEKLTPAEIKLIKDWILSGAK